MKIRIKSSLNPAIFRGDKFDRIVAGTIWEVNGEKWEHNYVAVTPGITFEQIEWVRDLPPVKKDKIKKAIDQIELLAEIYGTGIGEIVVGSEMEYIPATQAIPGVQGQAAIGVIEKPRVAVKLVPVNPKNFLFDPNGTSIDDCMGVAIEKYVSIHKVVRGIERGIYRKVGTEEVLQLNGGVFAFQRNARTKAFFKSWFNKYRELLCKRTEARNASPSGTPEKCVSWWYAPPADHISDGRFVLLYTNSGAQAPLSHWRTYKPKEIFTQHDAWDLFFNMMDASYVPFPGTALPQLKSAIKKQ